MRYFATNSSRNNRGKRFFREDPKNDDLVQVTVDAGSIKRGRGNLVGITRITKSTFSANYYYPGYVSECSKKEYDAAFTLVTNSLRE